MAWGTLVHALLEDAMRGPARDRAHLERVARWLTLGAPELRRVVPEALDTVDRVMASAFWRRAMDAPERQVEVPFAVRVEDAGGPPRVLHGVVDLAVRTAEGWALVDYKTDRADLAALVRAYGAQVGAYAAQWARLTGTPVASAALFAVRSAEVSADLAGASANRGA